MSYLITINHGFCGFSTLFFTFAVTKDCSKCAHGKFANADIKISRSCPAGRMKSLKKALRISAKLNVPMEKSLSYPGKEAFMLKKRGFYL